MQDSVRLEAELAREREARLEAEELLRRKSAELVATRNEMLNFHRELELRVEERTSRLLESLEMAQSYAARARAASVAKSTFLANVSHELRTPLHAILSFSRFGRDGVGDSAESPREHFEIIERSAQDLLALVDGLLDLAKLESGRDPPILAPTDLGELVLLAVEELAGIAAERGLRITTRVTEGGAPVHLDARKIRRVLRNLVSNALRYSPDGAGPVEVVAERTEGHVRISVRDHGVGIPAAERESIFEKFVQSSRTSDGAGGTGLGLAICREIVLRHGGAIWVEEAPGGGSAFCLTLPLRPEGQNPGSLAPPEPAREITRPGLEAASEDAIEVRPSATSCSLDRELVAVATATLEPLSPTATRLAEIVTAEETSLEEIERVVSLDPVLTGRLLRYANSASAARRGVATVRAAVMQMGLGQLLTFAAAGSVRRQFGEAIPQYGLSEGVLWRHLVASALAVELLPPILKRAVPPEAFTAALLHDLGKLVIGRFLEPEGIRQIAALREERGLSLAQAEREVLGIEHGEVGALTASQWHLPESIVRGIAHYSHPELVEDAVSDLVHVGNVAAKSIGEPQTPEGADLCVDPGVRRRLGLTDDRFTALLERLRQHLDQVLERYG